MRNFILLISAFIVVVLIIGTYFYQTKEPIRLPHHNFPGVTEEDTASLNQSQQPQANSLQPVNNDTISYTLQNDELHITYDKGNDWIKVPIEKNLLFEGEYSGNEQELIEGSYILTENYAVFLYSEDASDESKSIVLKYSLDQGKTWKKSTVTDSFSPIRFRKVDFLNDQFGYVIISGGRTMSQEYSIAFLTHDGGRTWEATAEPPTTRLFAFGGFVDETSGFLSYGTINPEEPDLYVTQDGGSTWTQADFHIPEMYDRIFVQAEVPVKEGDHLSVLVNQGPNGDYEGGKVKGKFISEDNGLTWTFQVEVHPDETE